MTAAAASSTAGAAGESSDRSRNAVHLAWQVGIVITVCAGLFHLINLVDAGRWELGPLLLTPFRTAFIATWLLLPADYLLNRRRLRLDYADVIVALLAAVFLLRGMFVAETFGIAVNWVLTGAGMFFLVKHGTQGRRDICLLMYTITVAVLVICLFGLVEYVAKSNPFFESIQVTAIGADTRIAASEQFYRIRSLVGHPGFLSAVLLIAAPVAAMVFRRRPWLLAAVMLLMAIVIFLTFSRGSWLLAALVIIPALIYSGRRWLRRNLRWIGLAVLIMAAVLVLDYWSRDAVELDLAEPAPGRGLRLLDEPEAPYETMEGEGVRPLANRLFFQVQDDSISEDGSAVTVVVRYLDAGRGQLRIEYSPASVDAGSPVSGEDRGTEDRGTVVWERSTPPIDKTDTQMWTIGAFYIEEPGFTADPAAADFSLYDGDNLTRVSRVEVQKGKLKWPDVVAQQWITRKGSLVTRMGFFPFTRDLLRQHPLGVGLFNTPGTDHHAIDSLPLTWMIEFGWPGLLLIAGLIWLLVSEGIKVLHHPRGLPAAVYLSLLVMALHGLHLMIIYDKPSLVLSATLAAVYADIRPWRRGGPVAAVRERDCEI